MQLHPQLRCLILHFLYLLRLLELLGGQVIKNVEMLDLSRNLVSKLTEEGQVYKVTLPLQIPH